MKGEQANEQARSIGQVVSRSMAEQDYVYRLSRRSTESTKENKNAATKFFSLSLSLPFFSLFIVFFLYAKCVYVCGQGPSAGLER